MAPRICARPRTSPTDAPRSTLCPKRPRGQGLRKTACSGQGSGISIAPPLKPNVACDATATPKIRTLRLRPKPVVSPFRQPLETHGRHQHPEADIRDAQPAWFAPVSTGLSLLTLLNSPRVWPMSDSHWREAESEQRRGRKVLPEDQRGLHQVPRRATPTVSPCQTPAVTRRARFR